jgi:6-phosphogluconolactonase (cycloisomerase 2 family)
MLKTTRAMRGRLIVVLAAILSGAAAALVAGLLAAPASGVTNLYAAQGARSTGTANDEVRQFAAGARGVLTELAPPAELATRANDLAITPDGRFAYATRTAGQSGFIAQFVRGAGGRMTPIGEDVPAGSDPRGILVDPQGTRVYYVDASRDLLSFRTIGADGALGAATDVALGDVSPRFVAMTPSGTSLYVSAVPFPGTAAARVVASVPGVAQFDVGPATGTVEEKPVAFVPWPGDESIPADLARMTVSPDGRHLYLASGLGATGIARFAIDAAGALADGSVTGLRAKDPDGTSVTAISPSGLFLWAPTSALARVGRIDGFSIDAAGALSDLTPASVPYVVDLPTADAAPSPDGRTLFLGQDGNVGSWSVATGGALKRADNHTRSAGLVTNGGIAVSPSQAPIASFTAVPQRRRSPTTFDARRSVDPGGRIARYDWDFGDGTTLADGGPRPRHVYLVPGTWSVTLVVTDADGTSTSKLWTGTQMLRNGGPSARTTRDVRITAAVAPRPSKRKSATIAGISGTVRVKPPGSRSYVDVSVLRGIALGSTIDASRGRVRVTVEVDATTHRMQSSLFYAGTFRISQTLGARPLLVAKLVGGAFAGCGRGSARIGAIRGAGRAAGSGRVRFAAKRRSRSKRSVRRLWGRGKGDFRTAGKRSSATVRGTWWLVEDRCDGTLTRVKRGTVDVRDLRLRKTIRLQAGKRSKYLAEAP